MPFREPDTNEPRCVAQTSYGGRCRHVGRMRIGLERVCSLHFQNGFIPFFPSSENPMVVMRQRAVLGLENV